jgi:hypothetical protein
MGDQIEDSMTSKKDYARMDDSQPKGTLPSREEKRARQEFLNTILNARPTEAQLQLVGEPSLKAAKVLGEARLATKSVAGLAFFGDDGRVDAEAIRRANAEWIEEKLRRQTIAQQELEASLGMPSKEQLDYPPAARKRPVSIKAMQLLGDDNLAMAAKMQLPDSGVPRLKALKVFGSASALAAPKARRILGPSDDDGEARAQADRQWVEEMTKRAENFMKEVVARKPHESLTSIPMDKGPIAAKALAFFGDEGLRRKSLRALKTRPPPKAIHVLGEAGLAGTKAEVLTGAAIEDINTKRKPLFSPLLNYRKLFRSALTESC